MVETTRILAEYLTSALALADCPQDSTPEVAFIGRSNSGKSSCLNRLTGSKTLARVSKTPGRTQLLNFFTTSFGGRLVDLPGYGYARVSKQLQAKWGHAAHEYLQKRPNLVGLVLIMDARHIPQSLDQEMIEWCREQQIPLLILLNKVDKTNQRQRATSLRAVRELLANYESAEVTLFSAKSGKGTDEVQLKLRDWLQQSSN